MRVLVIEEWSVAADSLIQDLHAGTGAVIEYASSVDEGLLKIEQAHGNIDAVLYTITSSRIDPLTLPDRVREIANEALFRYPQFVLLASETLPLPCAVKCTSRQVVYLLREYPNQIVETVRVLLYKIRSSKPGPTIRIEFCQGHYYFFACGPTASEEIIVTAQICRLLLLLIRGTCTVDVLADTLGVSRPTIKKYMRELRLIFIRALEVLQILPPKAELVWMRRGSGGTLCGVTINSIWE